jgi:hypothetical protein
MRGKPQAAKGFQLPILAGSCRKKRNGTGTRWHSCHTADTSLFAGCSKEEKGMSETCTQPHDNELPPPCIARLEQIRVNWRDVVEDMVRQFGYRGNDSKRRWITAGGLSALEGAFEALGWDDPHYVNEGGCDHPDCAEWATSGRPTPEGYKSLCFKHYRQYDDDVPRD